MEQKPSTQQQQQTSDKDLRSRVQTAKTSLKSLKDLNVAAAIAGHNMYANLAAKNPNMQPTQILNKMSPVARKHYMSLANAIPSNALSGNVPLGQFRSAVQRLKALNNSAEFNLEDAVPLTEALKDEIQPPPMLVLRRKGIRIFPDGRRVALYTHEQLGLVFTIPYKDAGAGTLGSQVVPGVTSEETVTESLDQVAKYAQQDNVTSHAKHFKFADGSKLKVSHGAAKAIHMVHNALNDENKKKFADMLTTPKGFEKAAHFALSRVKFTIGDE